MSTTSGGPNNVNNGLVLHLDAANRKSYVSNVFPYPLDGYAWAVWGGYQMTITRDNTTTSPVGTSPMKIVTSGTSAYTNTYGSSGWTLAPSSQGKTWTFSFWVKGSSSFSASMLIFESNSSGNYITYGQPFYNVTTEWTRVSGTYTMTQATAAGVQVRIDCYVNGVTLWVDGLQLERTSTPSTFSSKVNTNGANINDLTRNINNGTIVNGVGFSSENNGSLVFNGTNDYMTLPLGFLSQITNTTLNFWFYWSDNQSWSRVFDFGTGTNINMFFTPKNGSSATPRFGITINGSVAEQSVTSPSALSLNTWYNYTITLNGSVSRMYRNGIFEATNTNTTLTPNSLGNTNQNYFGRSQYADPYYQGRISNFCIYNRVLTDNEILQNYNAQKSRFGLP